MSKYLKEIEEFGFATVPQMIDSKQIENLIAELSETNNSFDEKIGSSYGVRNLLNLSPEVRMLTESRKVKDLIESILGKSAQPVRAIFFDKTPDANWKVPWHQDLTIAVKEKRETTGFSAWTIKAGINHVQPPVPILEKMLAIRIHLDDADETNGVLKVLSGSHKNGRLGASEIQNSKSINRTILCKVERGSAFLMRPLLVHSSSSGTNPAHRRVIHIEFSAENLPNGLKWYGS